MMKNYDKSVETHNPNWTYILGHPYRILIIGGSGSGRANVLLNLIKHQWLYIDKIIFISKIHSDQSINYVLMEDKK